MANLSVVITVYNGARYLEAALNSLCEQTYRDFEVVLVDDGSTDASVSIVRRFEPKLDVKLLPNPINMGISESMRRALGQARSPFIVVFDQDDICAPDRLAFFADGFSVGAGLLTSDYNLIDENGEATGGYVAFPDFIDQENLFLELLKRNYFLGSAMGFDRTRLDLQIALERSNMATDYSVALELAKLGSRFLSTARPLLHYRTHLNNTSKNFVTRDEDAKRVLRRFLTLPYLREVYARSHPPELLAVAIACQFVDDFKSSAFMLTQLADIDLGSDGLTPRLTAEHLFYGACQAYHEGNLSLALDKLQSLNDQLPNSPVFLNNIGCVFARHKTFSEANVFFSQAIGLSPNYRDAVHNLAHCSQTSTVTPSFTMRFPRVSMV